MYRRLAEQEWARIPALSPGRDDPHKYGKRFRITHIVETLARQTGNVEAVVAVKKDVYLAQLYRMPLFAPWRTRPGVTFWDAPDRAAHLLRDRRSLRFKLANDLTSLGGSSSRRACHSPPQGARDLLRTGHFGLPKLDSAPDGVGKACGAPPGS
jgi:hypothetical protein